MPDREKVINELNEYIESALAICAPDVDYIPVDLLQYTVALLKEQDCNYCGTVFDVAYKAGKADAVVRCKDCKHIDISPSGLMKCNNVFRSPEWFCADGERKEGR